MSRRNRRRRGVQDELLQGLLLIDKPQGMTSHEVCQLVRSRLRLGKVGHGGTLDPFATGLLPLLLNGATRLAPFLQQRDKSYEALVRLGVRTDTFDPTGEVLERGDTSGVTEVLVREALEGFVGTQQQRVPLYAAARVDGKRLYEYARAGQEVERPVKEVVIHSIELRSFTPHDEGVDVDLLVHCGSGTYMRALADDLGEQLGCFGYLHALRRVSTGLFGAADSVTLDAVDEIEAGFRSQRQDLFEEGQRSPFDAAEHAERWRAALGGALLTVPQLLGDLPVAPLSGPLLRALHSGQPLKWGALSRSAIASMTFAQGDGIVLMHPDGRRAAALVKAMVSSTDLAALPPGASVLQVERVLK